MNRPSEIIAHARELRARRVGLRGLRLLLEGIAAVVLTIIYWATLTPEFGWTSRWTLPVAALLAIDWIVSAILEPSSKRRTEYYHWIEAKAWGSPEFLERLKSHSRDHHLLYGRTVEDLRKVFIGMIDGATFPPASYRALLDSGIVSPGTNAIVKTYWLDDDAASPGWRLTFINSECVDFSRA